MPLESPASLRAESIYGNGCTFTEPNWDTWKSNFVGQFLNPNELQTAQTAFDNIRMNANGSHVLAFKEAFRAAAVWLHFAYKANKLVLDGDQLALRYLTKLIGAVSVHVNSVVNINAAANRERKRGGNPSIELTMQRLMREAIQNQKDISLLTLGVTGKEPMPMDVNVNQTTVATTVNSIGVIFDTLRAELKAELNAFHTEFCGRKNFQPRRKDKDKENESFKCCNCGGANHMARHCTMPKKKEAGNA
jgi:hypothetical protein